MKTAIHNQYWIVYKCDLLQWGYKTKLRKDNINLMCGNMGFDEENIIGIIHYISTHRYRAIMAQPSLSISK